MDDRFAETANATNPVTRAVGPGTTQTSQSLYERIGGEKILDQIVTDVYNDMRADKDIGKLFARFRLERLKDRTVDYLRGEWGGPEGYKGSDLWISHSHMGIRNNWYDIMMKYYVKALKRAKLGKAETAEALASLEKMRAPIVDRDLKFKNMYLKHSEKLAEAAGGDGWGSKQKAALSPEEQKKKEQQEKEEEEEAMAMLEAAKAAAAPAPVVDRFAETRESANPVTRAIGPGTTSTSQTLFNRIGGEKILDQVVTDVYNDMRADKDIGKLFARFRLEKLKDRTVDYLRGEWGGPEAYKGSDLWISHSHMGIRNNWYDIMMKYYVKALKRAKVSKSETEECLASLEKMRAPIVDRDLKFKNMYLKHSEKLAAAAGGDGWGKKAGPASAPAPEPEQKKAATPAPAPAAAPTPAAAPKAKKQTTTGDAPNPPKAKTRSKEVVTSDSTVSSISEKKMKQPAPKEIVPLDPAFTFAPPEELDLPPMPLPGSAFSGADLICRLSVPCQGA